MELLIRLLLRNAGLKNHQVHSIIHPYIACSSRKPECLRRSKIETKKNNDNRTVNHVSRDQERDIVGRT